MKRVPVLLLCGALALTACNSRVESAPEQSPDEEADSTTTSTWLSLADKTALVVECLHERGFDVELHSSGLMIGFSGPQMEAAMVAEGECWEEVDARYGDPPPLSDEERYAAWVSTAECLEARGIHIPYIPTFDAFNGEERSWNPYTYVPPGDDMWRLHETCPQPGLGLTPSTISVDD